MEPLKYIIITRPPDQPYRWKSEYFYEYSEERRRYVAIAIRIVVGYSQLNTMWSKWMPLNSLGKTKNTWHYRAAKYNTPRYRTRTVKGLASAKYRGGISYDQVKEIKQDMFMMSL